MDTVKAVGVVLLGAYILFGQGPGWWGGPDTGSHDGLVGETGAPMVAADPGHEGEDAGLVETPGEIVHGIDACSELLDLVEEASGSMHLATQALVPGTALPLAPAPSDRSASAPSPTQRPAAGRATCLTALDAPDAPPSRPGSPGH